MLPIFGFNFMQHVYTHAIVKRYIENESNFTNAVKIQRKHIYLKNTYEKSLPHLSGSNELTVGSIPCLERISGWKQNITVTSQWAPWRLKSPASDGLLNRLSSADQIKHQSSSSLALVMSDRWIPLTKGQQRGNCFHLMTSGLVPAQPNSKPADT